MARNAGSQALVAIALCVSVLAGCNSLPAKDGVARRVVGAWFVKMPEAPFQYHMLMFNADGTMMQSNPDAGHASTSDSNGMGAWVAEGNHVIGKFVEVTADRTTRAFASRGEIAFDIDVGDDTFSGSGSARFYDANGALDKGPLAFTLSGVRIRPR